MTKRLGSGVTVGEQGAFQQLARLIGIRRRRFHSLRRAVTYEDLTWPAQRHGECHRRMRRDKAIAELTGRLAEHVLGTAKRRLARAVESEKAADRLSEPSS
jgi:hypothetical protein